MIRFFLFVNFCQSVNKKINISPADKKLQFRTHGFLCGQSNSCNLLIVICLWFFSFRGSETVFGKWLRFQWIRAGIS